MFKFDSIELHSGSNFYMRWFRIVTSYTSLGENTMNTTILNLKSTKLGPVTTKQRSKVPKVLQNQRVTQWSVKEALASGVEYSQNDKQNRVRSGSKAFK